jgi:hypothetical protein
MPAPMILFRCRLALALALLAGIGLGPATPISAQDAALTGAQVLERCTSADSADSNWCVGYVYGIGTVVSDVTIDRRYRTCFPAEVTSDIARLAVIQTLRTNEALHAIPGTHAVWYALVKAFACPQE